MGEKYSNSHWRGGGAVGPGIRQDAKSIHTWFDTPLLIN